MTVLDQLRQAVIDGEAKAAADTVIQALQEGVAPGILLQEGLIAAMHEVGRLFEEGEIYVPEMLIAARAMSTALTILKPRLAEGDEAAPAGIVAIGTVEGDLHDIGKNLVAIMLEGSGFTVVDLGVDVAPARFVEAVKDGAQVVAMSALLTTTMTNMKTVVEAIAAAGLRDRVRIIVGGAPVTDRYAAEIGADGYAADAAKAARTVLEVLTA